MQRLTVRGTTFARYLPRCTSGLPQFVAFDYVLHPDASVRGVEARIADDADSETVRWFPAIRRGIDLGCQWLREHYDTDLVGVVVTITKVISHPIVTTEDACVRFGRKFIVDRVGTRESMVCPAPGSP